MTMQDPLADLLTRIRNGQQARKTEVAMPHSKIKVEVCRVLLEEGYITDYQVEESDGRKLILVTLKYESNGTPVIERITRKSKPGLRLYTKASEVPKVIGGYGVAVLTTCQGVMSDRQARKNGVGGEIICEVY